MAQDIERLYQKSDPAKPLEPHDLRYISCEGVRGNGDLIARVANAIRRSDDPMHLLFTGHRGAGKSTELLRLQERLANPLLGEDRFFVVYFEADEEDIDVNDVDYPDLLLAMIRQVGKALREREQIELRPARLVRFFEDMKTLLGSEVVFEKVDLDTKIAKFTAAIKSSPTARADIRRALEPNVSSLIQAANDLLDEAVTRLKVIGYRDLVLIVDNLDRIVLRDIPDSQYNTQEQLFINRGSQLAEIRCHVVYTVPISLIYSPKATMLTTIFSKDTFTLPMVKVINRERQDNPAGLKAMEDMVRARLTDASVTEAIAFDSTETLDHLCRMSGGHARNLLILLRSACDYLDALPVTRTVLEEAIQGMRTAYERALNRPEFFDTLRQIDETQDLPGTADEQVLLYNLSVLEYINGEPCYAVNPIVRTMSKFKAAGKPKSRSSHSL